MPITVEDAEKFTLAAEAGYVDNPNDPGGPTNFGVSLRWLRGLDSALADVDNDGDVDADDIRALTKEQAEALYIDRFWFALHCDKLPGCVGMVLFDTAVNCAPARAVRQLQQVCKDFGQAMTVDGQLGPATLGVVDAVTQDQGEKTLAEAMLWTRQDYYNELADKPKLRGFHLGWTRRVCALRKYIQGAA